MASDTRTLTARAAEHALTTLALDLRWSWNHATDPLWRQIDPECWDRTRNPWTTLNTASRAHLKMLLGKPAFRRAVTDALAAQAERLHQPTWFGRKHDASPLSCIAYFSMEYMLSEALPIYSGGLGNVAGDQLKAASDLGVPVVAVGLLFAQGYFRQELTSDGRQQALYPFNDPSLLPLSPVLTEEGDVLRIPIHFGQGPIWVRAWKAVVGRATLYLLDTNDPANPPGVRCVTTQLYGGDADLRLRQEITLGIAGWRLLDQLGYQPDVCHLNEGHAAFAAVERARCLMDRLRIPFRQALVIARAGTLFTTHTAVPAGFDRFPPGLIGTYLAHYVEKRLDIPLDTLLALGRADPNDHGEPFNMAWLAIHVSGAVNGVSRLHGAVSRRLFAPLFPRWPEREVPVGHVTNGVHTPTWDSIEADTLWTEAAGSERWRGTQEGLADRIRALDDRTLWTTRCQARAAFIHKVAATYAERQGFSGDVGLASLPVPALSPDVLTLGFARRFATYKRPDLLLHDPDRLARLLSHPEQPMQLVLAGKAHPADLAGQALITRWLAFARRPDVRGRIVFMTDYDMAVAQILVQGVDLWINTPRRPWEASGTSGMKVLVNGGLNLSELDGWWAEAYAPEVGWALGDGREHGEDPAVDTAEAEAMYTLLESEIAPAFYARDGQGIPAAWVGRMRESMARLTPLFSANRVVRDYTDHFYLPAATRYHARLADGGQAAHDIVQWQDRLDTAWPELRIASVTISGPEGQRHVAVALSLGHIPADAVQVQLYADPIDAGPPSVTVIPPGDCRDSDGLTHYTLTTGLDRPAGDYTVRVIPARSGIAIPLESTHITWQR
ncbi:glucan phosphorylase [Gluconacetobacter sacchari DSM 12717]|uniref:Alpha-glucan family phosphorylase n=2 Tax=Gluconacetobacter sacchari TaxID=92759 RepID=A0A7W4NL94_9PROT|nr:alpha-glucan family phosphorylase [Gluconacetobacter sacchari]MBB2159851.1 alpha-glucan family phosphorylase [Gluconacetobacter sacchari]GBQ28411.1 glucan phosphorylase [Gluconacetobacter sacchari DSM 12717]